MSKRVNAIRSFTCGISWFLYFVERHMRIQAFIRRFLCRSKYDYRDLWIKFSEISTNSPKIHSLLPKVADFIARAMSVRQWRSGFALNQPTTLTSYMPSLAFPRTDYFQACRLMESLQTP